MQQQQAHNLPVAHDKEQSRIHEEERQRSMGMAQMQSQQRPQTPPALEMEEDIYGIIPRGEAQLEAWKTTRANTESKTTSANEAKSEFVQATEQRFETETPMEEDPTVQQQPVIEGAKVD